MQVLFINEGDSSITSRKYHLKQAAMNVVGNLLECIKGTYFNAEVKEIFIAEVLISVVASFIDDKLYLHFQTPA